MVTDENRAEFFPAEAQMWKSRSEDAVDTHSGVARSFIRAEVVAYDAPVEFGPWDAARKHRALRLEGKDYPVQDGDVLLIRFNVG